MKQFTITKENFLNWYFNTGSDQDQVSTAKELGYAIIEQLIENNTSTITTEEVFEECEVSCIPLAYLEEYSNDYDGEIYELSELKDQNYEVKLIDNV